MSYLGFAYLLKKLDKYPLSMEIPIFFPGIVSTMIGLFAMLFEVESADVDSPGHPNKHGA